MPAESPGIRFHVDTTVIERAMAEQTRRLQAIHFRLLSDNPPPQRPPIEQIAPLRLTMSHQPAET